MRERPLPPDIPVPGSAADEWERHAGFLKRMARGVLADAASADDALQDAWIASRKGGATSSGRAWLAGVVRNIAAQWTRSEARQHARERRAARSESLPSAVDTVARIEVLQRVVEAVHDLEEPYRTILLLRFLDELTPGDIARRQGVPTETVRSQVRRGLQRLRESLSSEANGDDRTWLTALLPFADLSALNPVTPLAGSTAASTPALSQVALMSTKAKLLLTLGVLATASFLTWQTRDTSEPAGSPSTVEESLQQVASITTMGEVALEPEVTEAQREVLPVASQARVISGRALLVVEPFADLQLVVRIWEQESDGPIETEGAPDREMTITTDEAGEFSVTLDADVANVAIVAQPTGVFPESRRYSWKAGRVDVLRGEAPNEVVVFLQLLDTALTGLVTDMEGNPIAGAKVHTFGDPATSDENGRYYLPMRARETVFAFAEARGFSQLRTHVNGIAANEERELNITLKQEFRVEGVVLDIHGHPVEDALVTSFYTFQNDVLSDELGYYDLGHLDPGRPKHMIHVSKEGWVSSQMDVPTEADGIAAQDFTLDRGVRVEGHVLDASGNPLAGAELYIGFSPHAFNRLDATSAEDGSFAFPSVQRGPEKLVVEHEDFATNRQVITMPEDLDELIGIEVIMEQGHSVGGYVLNEGREPLEGIWVSVRYYGEHVDAEGKTDAEGYFRIEDLPANHLKLSFYAPGMALQRLSHIVERVDVDDLEITMHPAGRIAGRVIDSTTGRPIESFSVRFVDPELQPGDEPLRGYSASWAREGWHFEEAGGRWNTDRESDLAPGGIIGIEIRAEGYAPALVPRVLVMQDPDPDALVHLLSRGVDLKGSVADEVTGAPIEGALVKLYRVSEPIELDDSEDTYGRAITRTDRAGFFRFKSVPQGRSRLLVVHGAYPAHLDGPFEVGSEGAAPRAIELVPGAIVSGVLRDGQGAPRPSRVIQILPGNTSVDGLRLRRTATTDAAGCFRVEGLPSGTFLIGPRIGMRQLELTEFTLPFELAKNETRELVLEPPGTANLRGRFDTQGDVPRRFPVTLTRLEPDSDTKSQRLRSNAIAHKGRFEFTGVAAGTYEISIEWHDYGTRTLFTTSAPKRVTLAEGENIDVWVELKNRTF